MYLDSPIYFGIRKLKELNRIPTLKEYRETAIKVLEAQNRIIRISEPITENEIRQYINILKDSLGDKRFCCPWALEKTCGNAYNCDVTICIENKRKIALSTIGDN